MESVRKSSQYYYTTVLFYFAAIFLEWEGADSIFKDNSPVTARDLGMPNGSFVFGKVSFRVTLLSLDKVARMYY